MTRSQAYIWIVGVFFVVFAATIASRVGFVLLAPLVSLISGAAAAVWLGHAAHASAAAAVRASATAGLGGALATVMGFAVAVPGGDVHSALLGVYGMLLVAVGLGLINLGVSMLGGALAWLAVSEAAIADQIRPAPRLIISSDGSTDLLGLDRRSSVCRVPHGQVFGNEGQQVRMLVAVHCHGVEEQAGQGRLTRALAVRQVAQLPGTLAFRVLQYVHDVGTHRSICGSRSRLSGACASATQFRRLDRLAAIRCRSA